jgi:outer membrane protein
MSTLRLLVLLAVAGGCSAVCAEEPVALTLAEALQRTESANVAVLLSREAAAQAVAQADQQRVGVLPNVGLSAQQRRSNSVDITNGVATRNPASNRFDGQLNASLALLNAAQLSAWKSARVGAVVAGFDHQAALQSALATVASGYFTHLRNLRRIEVLDANVARAQGLLTLARNLLAGGAATQIDVTRAESQLAQAEQARLQQQTTVVASELTFKRLLDLDAQRPLALANFAVRRGTNEAYAFGRERTLFDKRPDYLRTQKALDQTKIDVRTARYERLPSFALGGTYGYAAAEFDDSGMKNEWSAGVTVSLPIFDGLRSNADRRFALSRQRAQEVRLRDLEQQIGAELRLALQDANSRDAQIEVAARSLRLAEDELRLARTRFEQGVANNREIIDAQNNLAIASDGLVDAVYQFNLARVELARVKGDVRAILQERVE